MLQCDRIAIPDENRHEEEEKHPMRPLAVAAVKPEQIMNQGPNQPQIRPGMQAFLNPELPVVLELD